ncbi:hypothetical protein R1flu_002348 [Riccia fluitans]|uniref:Uncharacterized protein n=1 Tax=Riccia fluitans TaxID=41844 RepID=A0ABD1Y654_9MARC
MCTRSPSSSSANLFKIIQGLASGFLTYVSKNGRNCMAVKLDDRQFRHLPTQVMMMKDLPDAMKQTQQGGTHSVKISIDGVTREAVVEPLTSTQLDKGTSVPSGVDVPGSSGGGEEEGADKTFNPDKTLSDGDVPDWVKDSLPNL